MLAVLVGTEPSLADALVYAREGVFPTLWSECLEPGAMLRALALAEPRAAARVARRIVAPTFDLLPRELAAQATKLFARVDPPQSVVEAEAERLRLAAAEIEWSVEVRRTDPLRPRFGASQARVSLAICAAVHAAVRVAGSGDAGASADAVARLVIAAQTDETLSGEMAATWRAAERAARARTSMTIRTMVPAPAFTAVLEGARRGDPPHVAAVASLQPAIGDADRVLFDLASRASGSVRMTSRDEVARAWLAATHYRAMTHALTRLDTRLRAHACAVCAATAVPYLMPDHEEAVALVRWVAASAEAEPTDAERATVARRVEAWFARARWRGADEASGALGYSHEGHLETIASAAAASVRCAVLSCCAAPSMGPEEYAADCVWNAIQAHADWLEDGTPHGAIRARWERRFADLIRQAIPLDRLLAAYDRAAG